MAEELSWKKIRNQRRKENFVGRGDEVRAFTENFAIPPKYMVFAVTGEGGVGKSTLLKRFTEIATSPDIDAIVITCDDRQTSPVSVMGHIAAELSKLGVSHKDFDERYKTYLQLRQEIESDPKVPRSATKVFSMGITDFTIKSLRKTPGVGVFFEYTDENVAGEALGELIQYGMNKWGNKDEVQLISEPENILSPLFLTLIQKACEKKRIVIMFDVFEITGDILSSWLLALFNFEYGEFGTNLSFVISGRDPLDQQWTDLASMICFISLQPFTLEETNLYLRNQGITETHLSNQIYEYTGGIPVLVEVLAATKPQPGSILPDISKDAVERFLQWTPQAEKRKAALLATVPRQFSREILGAILDDKAGEMFNWLARQSYILRTTERGWFVHREVRELMLRYLRTHAPIDLATAHARLKGFYGAIQNQLNLQNKIAYENESWRKYECERLYHMVSEEPDKNNATMISAFLQAFRWNWKFSANIVEVCRQVGSEMGSWKTLETAEILSTAYNAYNQNDYDTVTEKLYSLETNNELTEAARCEIFLIRGEICRALQKYEKALIYFSNAIKLAKNDNWPIVCRGEIYRLTGNFEKALVDLNFVIEHDENNILALVSRGMTYMQAGKLEDALKDLDHAVSLDSNNVLTIVSRAMAYMQMGKFDNALNDLNQAIALDENNIMAITTRGEVYKLLGENTLALADLNRAIGLREFKS